MTKKNDKQQLSDLEEEFREIVVASNLYEVGEGAYRDYAVQKKDVKELVSALLQAVRDVRWRG